MNKTNILFVLPSLRLGGAEIVFTKLLNAWDFEDTEVTLIVLNSEGAKLAINNPKITVIKKRFSKVVFSTFFLLRYVSSKKIDSVVSTNSNLNTVLLVVKRASFNKFKLFIRDASVSSIMDKYGVKQLPGYVGRMIRKLKRYLYPGADKIICQSSDISADIVSSLELTNTSLLVTIANPIDIPSSYRESIKMPFNNNDTITFVSVARFMPVKGHERLIRIFSTIKRPFRLKLIGEGPNLNLIKQMAADYHLSDQVMFAGAIIPPYHELGESHAYVQASYVEGFPNALLEATGMGLPAIAFDVPGGTREIIHSKNGILIPDNDENAFAEAIESFNPFVYDRKWISNDVHERFGIKKILEQYRDLVFE